MTIDLAQIPTLQESTSERFALPAPQAGRRWLRAGEQFMVGGLRIRGPLYVGSIGTSAAGDGEPSMVDPDLPISKFFDGTMVSKGHFVSYVSLSAAERRCYLEWLAEGRADPEIDIRLASLYLFGLERRAIADAALGLLEEDEADEIATEAHRLGLTYSKHSEFAMAAARLVHWILHREPPSCLYERRDPLFHRLFGLPLYTSIAMGQAAFDGHPVGVNLARTWVLRCGGAYLSKVLIDNRELFEMQFASRFNQAYPNGYRITEGRTGFTYSFSPASKALMNHPALTRGVDTVLCLRGATKLTQDLRAIFKKAEEDIETYASIAQRHRHSMHSLEVLTKLPCTLWPDSAKLAMDRLREAAQTQTAIMTAQQLLDLLHPTAAFKKAAAHLIGEVLLPQGLCTEPPLITSTGRAIKAETPVCVIHGEGAAEESAIGPARALVHAIAALMHLAGIEEANATWLMGRLRTWPVESIRGNPRLRAAALTALAEPPTLAAAKKLLVLVPEEQGKWAMALCAEAITFGGEPTPAQISAFTSFYPVFGLNRKNAASDLHAAAAGTKAQMASEGFRLDMDRVRHLQEDTERVNQLLSDIFTEEIQANPEVPPAPGATQPAGTADDAFLGVQGAAAAFGRQLISQPEWSRADLQALAATHGLMLDGTLERLNEAAFDTFDAPLTEGEDPIEITPEAKDHFQ